MQHSPEQSSISIRRFWSSYLLVIMAHFSDLSNELVLLVMKHVQPQDLDNFFLCCKHFRQLGGAYVREHMELKRRFKFIEQGKLSDNSHQGQGRSINLLKEIITSPRKASYVEKLAIRGADTKWNEESLSEPFQTIFKEEVRLSRYLPTAQTMRLIDRSRSGWKVTFLNLVLTLLPNLSTFKMDGLFADKMLTVISTTYRISQDPQPTILTMLNRVEISADIGPLIPLGVIECFATLPSVRDLYANGVYNRSYGFPYNKRPSRVTSLSLTSCDVGAETLSKFLRSFDSIVNLEYIHEDLSEGHEKEGFLPAGISDMLGTGARKTLKTLTSRGDPKMGSLLSYNVLEEIDADLEAMIWNVSAAVQKLEDVLPISMKKVTLRHQYGNDTIRICLMPETPAPVEQALPVLGMPLDLSQRWLDVCTAAGIALTFDDETDDLVDVSYSERLLVGKDL